MTNATATEIAERHVAAVRDDPAARLALLRETYRGPTGDAPQQLPFRRAAVAFMKWQVDRGVLASIGADPPGSEWWRSVNERLLFDGCLAVAIVGGHEAADTPRSVRYWLEFVENPNSRTWYRAHNASIVAAYLENAELAAKESLAERFFINVALVRVLYAHALVEAPKLALGPCAPLGRVLGDPRLGMAGAFLSLGRVLPNRYPLGSDVSLYMRGEHRLGRLLDYAVIAQRADELYAWSAEALDEPRVAGLCVGGNPTYAWPAEEENVWRDHDPSRTARLVTWATRSRV